MILPTGTFYHITRDFQLLSTLFEKKQKEKRIPTGRASEITYFLKQSLQ